MHPIFGNVHQLGARQLQHALTRPQHGAHAVELRPNGIDKGARRHVGVAGLEQLIHQPAALEPLCGMRLAAPNQLLGQAHARLARHQRVTAHTGKQIERDLRKPHARIVLRQHEMVRQRRFKAAPQRAAFDHRNADRAGVETASRRMHAVDAGARVGHHRLALAVFDRVGEELQIAADVEHVRHQRAGDPEIEPQRRFLRRLRQRHDVFDQRLVEAGARRGAQQHPHDVPPLFIVGGQLRQIARFGKRAAGGVIKQFHKTFQFFC